VAGEGGSASKRNPAVPWENARVRGLDPANVVAFAQPRQNRVPEVDENEELRRPTELDQLCET